MTGNIPPPPGWYPDPWAQKPWRWWDGGRWTGHVADPSNNPGSGPGAPVAPGPWPSAPVATGFPVASPEVAFHAESAMTPWAERAFAWYAVVVAVGLLVAWSESSHFRQVFHELRVQASTGVAPTGLHSSVLRTDLLGLVNLAVAAPFYVGVLMWQHRAATMARRLGLPAVRSAGLGVGSWFIPVVNLWFPYQALRDCLPPGHADRPTVGRLWTCFITLIVVTPIADVLMWVGTPVALVFAAAAMALGVGFAYFGIRTVRAVAAAHQGLITGTEGVPPVPA